MVTLSLRDAGNATQLRLTQRGFATQERYALHRAGWSETFDRLEQYLVGAPRDSGSGTD